MSNRLGHFDDADEPSPAQVDAYDAEQMGADIGHGITIRWTDDRNLLWKHPECRSWSSLSFDIPPGTGHVLVQRDPLTIRGSLLCPMGCGKHGFITDGKWVPA